MLMLTQPAAEKQACQLCWVRGEPQALFVKTKMIFSILKNFCESVTFTEALKQLKQWGQKCARSG